jgi:hypothetical protein
MSHAKIQDLKLKFFAFHPQEVVTKHGLLFHLKAEDQKPCHCIFRRKISRIKVNDDDF